jgi:ferredoxin
VVTKDREGKDITLKQPHVDIKECIGCGICETKCPVVSAPAIYVVNTNESRSEENLLQVL